MVNARLHSSCGNCGDNSMLDYKIERDYGHMADDTLEDEAVISCGNCATLHSLSEVLPKATPRRKSEEED